MPEAGIAPLNSPVDASEGFCGLAPTYFCATRINVFDPVRRSGSIEWKRYRRKPRTSFNQVLFPFEEARAWEFPPEYGEEKTLPFELSFLSPRTIRIRITAAACQGLTRQGPDPASPMLARLPTEDDSWNCERRDSSFAYQSAHGSLTLRTDPMRLELRDRAGKLLTRTRHIGDQEGLVNCDPLPCCFIQSAEDMNRSLALSLSLSPDEMLFGCGESFTRLNKRGQKLVLCSTDPKGTQTANMYKPVPFFMSSSGYAMFVHTSAPLAFDFGHSHDGTQTLFLADDCLDLFIFLGGPREVLSEYTALTGRSPLPPLWSFGLWMGRISYRSEQEVRDVAKQLRAHAIPCDVIHLDTGWFETDWRCDYRFSGTRFKDPAAMIRDLRTAGFHLSLWQVPYFTPSNPLHREAVARGFAVLDSDGRLPTEDAILDFSNPSAVEWYQDLLARLFDLGVEAIKADFGEEAPLRGRYASGRSGLHEHNLYPLRYQKAVFDVTARVTGNSLIWARGGWAGCQRYPLHWGGDAENTDCAMAATLRAGLSLGLCGFSFWSHDIGGFVKKSPVELYRRWLAFGALTSHSRCHGAPPREPWEYGEEFTAEFRRIVELKYRLMPYVYAQAHLSADAGFPMLRTLFFEFPDDPTAWRIEDQYMFGADLLVAPLMESGCTGRKVFLPRGAWIDYQTHTAYEGGTWRGIEAGEIPAIIMVRDGAVIPHVPVAQSTAEMDWSSVELLFYRVHATSGTGSVLVPGGTLEQVTVGLDEPRVGGRLADRRVRVIQGKACNET